MISALCKRSLRTRTWYIHTLQHTVLTASVNAWFLHSLNLRITQPNKKFVQFKTFIAQIVDSLGNTAKRPVGKPSIKNEQPSSKVYRVQGNPSRDTHKDGVNHMPKWNEKRRRYLSCKTAFSFVSCKKTQHLLMFK